MAPRSKKGNLKATTFSKAKATKKRALPEEEGNAPQCPPDSSTAATGEKPSKRLRSSTVVDADVDGTVPPATIKPVVEAAKTIATRAIASTADTLAAVLPHAPNGHASTSKDTPTTLPAPETAQKTEVFAGSFGLYSMDIEAFNVAYAPPYDANGDFDEAFYPEALYNALIASQNKAEEEPTAKLIIPSTSLRTSSPSLDDDDDDDEEDTSYATLTLSSFIHPYCGGPIEIDVTCIGEQPQEALSSEIETDLGRPTDAWDDPGIRATLEIQDYKLMSHIPEASGKSCLRPLWMGVGDDEKRKGKVMELFEGSLSFKCTFDRIWWKRGGKGVEENIVFWAVRRKN